MSEAAVFYINGKKYQIMVRSEDGDTDFNYFFQTKLPWVIAQSLRPKKERKP